MIKILNFILNTESWIRSQPKKFWRHCWNMARFMMVWVIGKMILDGLQKFSPLDHYTLISACFYIVLAVAVGRFAWRAYVGMERDLDFYMED